MPARCTGRPRVVASQPPPAPARIGPMPRSSLLLLLLAAPAAADGLKGTPDPKEPIVWYDARDLGVEGRGWAQTKAPYDRLPAEAEKLVRQAVWGLSRHSAGLCVRFVTEATS